MNSSSFEDEDMTDAVFRDVALGKARFIDVDLRAAVFEDVSLDGAQFTDVSLKDVAITDACIEGLHIMGFDIHALIMAEQERQKLMPVTSGKFLLASVSS
jgi:uncharacterized protein YjbI with pentapeptide repeats